MCEAIRTVRVRDEVLFSRDERLVSLEMRTSNLHLSGAQIILLMNQVPRL